MNKHKSTGIVTSKMCIMMKFKPEFFNMLEKEWVRKQKEKLAMFLYKSLPDVNRFYTLHKIT
jgi:hypothetical protein